jgi:acyl-CoA synthetase (AMP-forming)/AMP-acid ligase II
VLPDSTIGALRRVFPGARVVRQFGLTECKRITIMPPELDDARPGSVGRALRGTEVRILDPADRPVPAGLTGEIVVTGPHVMAGYWRAPELTAHTFRVDRHGVRHLHTGDYGYLDEDGYLYFEGRKDNVFKRRGVRMSTVEIEAAALDIPGVRAAAAMPPTGQRDLALCVAGELTSTAVLRELRGRLEPAKVPATCLVLPEFPLTTQGKHAMGELALLLDGAER